MILTHFSPAKVTLSPTRTPLLNGLLRQLEGGTRQHILLSGKVGSGRSSLAQALLGLGPAINRKHRLKLDIGAVSTGLFEPVDASEFFEGLRQSVKSYARGLVIVLGPDGLIEGLERHEARRLTRFFSELLDPHDLRCLLVADEEQTVKFLSLSPGLKRLFAVHQIPPLDTKESIELLKAKVSEDLAVRIVELVGRFYPDRGLPGGALQLFSDAGDLAAQSSMPVDETILHQVVSEQCQLPLSSISTTNVKELRTLAAQLNQRVIGQPHAVQTVVRTIQRAQVGLTSAHRPIASFLFLGPSGVGKTELAKSLAELLYKSPRAFTRVDMSEFSESHTVQRLIGSPPGYVGYEEGGQLTNPVDREPYSLILLDEIEKAHPKVFDIFLQLLDDGRLTDGRGKTVDFRNTIVVATSNVGLHEIVAAAETGALKDRERFLRSALLPLLVEHFRPEFLNRFDAIIAFGPLSPEQLAVIGRKQVDELQNRLRRHTITLEVSDERLLALAHRAYQPTFGARPMRRLIQDEIEAPIAEQLVQGTIQAGQLVTV